MPEDKDTRFGVPPHIGRQEKTQRADDGDRESRDRSAPTQAAQEFTLTCRKPAEVMIGLNRRYGKSRDVARTEAKQLSATNRLVGTVRTSLHASALVVLNTYADA